MAAKKDVLVGKYFHSFHPLKRGQAEPVLEWQGHIEGKLDNGKYLITTFSWASGGDYESRMVSLEEMHGWQFYPTNTAMNYWYDQYDNRRRLREEEKWRRSNERKQLCLVSNAS